MLADLRRGTKTYRRIKDAGYTVVCHKKSGVCFIVRDDDMLFAVSGTQTMRVMHPHIQSRFWGMHHANIRRLVLRRKIQDISDLYGACRGKAIIVPSNLEWHV